MSGGKAAQEAAAAAANPADADPMADASLADLEDEITEGPAADWEVAYVWSFLERFTNLVDFDATNPVMPNVMAFEQALVDSSPPSSAFAAAAAAADPAAAVAAGQTRTSARLEESRRRPPLTAVAVRSAQAAAHQVNGAASRPEQPDGDQANGNANGNGKKREGSPASSLSSLTASESGDAASPQDEAAHQAAIQAVHSATVEPVEPVPPLLPEGTECPPASEMLKDIVEVFIENLRPIKELSEYHGKKTWFHFLINFVSYRFNADPYYRGGFRWETNLLRTRGLKPGQEKEAKWWMLRWEDKVHLLRQLVDFQLTNAPAVRDIIKEQYDIGHQRNARRDPDANGLVLLPAGRTATHVTLYHLDSSPRLYACGDLYKDHSPWIAVSSTLKGYKAFLKTLAEPTRAERKAFGLPDSAAPQGPFAKTAAAVAAAKGKGKGKGKLDVGEDRKKEERLARARLEADFKDIAVYEKCMAAVEGRRMRAAERAARNIERSMYVAPATTRSSRLRARLNYNEDKMTDDGAGTASASPSGAEAGGGGDDDEAEEGGRRKRRRVDGAAANGGSAANSAPASEAGSEFGGRAGSRRSSGRQVPAPAAANGERRSSRLQQPAAAAVEPDADPKEEEEAVAGGSGDAPNKGAEGADNAAAVAVKTDGDADATATATSEALPAAAEAEGSTLPATPEEVPAFTTADAAVTTKVTEPIAKAEAEEPRPTEAAESKPMEEVQPAVTA